MKKSKGVCFSALVITSNLFLNVFSNSHSTETQSIQQFMLHKVNFHGLLLRKNDWDYRCYIKTCDASSYSTVTIGSNSKRS